MTMLKRQKIEEFRRSISPEEFAGDTITVANYIKQLSDGNYPESFIKCVYFGQEGGIDFELWAYRYETDDEYDKRLKEEENAKIKREERERETLAKLLKKYGHVIN